MFNGFNAAVQRFDLHDHARAAAVWPVVNLLVFIVGEIPEIMDFNGYDFLCLRPLQNTLIDERVENTREDGDKVELHVVHAGMVKGCRCRCSYRWRVLFGAKARMREVGVFYILRAQASLPARLC